MLLTVAGDHARLPAQSRPHRSQRLNRPSRSHLAISTPAADIDPRPGNPGHAIAGSHDGSDLARLAGFEPATRCLEGRFRQGVNLLLSWREPVCSSSGYSSVSPVSAPFWHAAGTGHASRCELPASESFRFVAASRRVALVPLGTNRHRPVAAPSCCTRAP